jgi:hypothetical protein
VRQLATGDRTAAIGWLLLGGGVAVWLVTLHPITSAGLTDVGLVGALPWGMWIAVAFVTAAFAVACEARHIPTRLAISCIVAIAVILYGTPAIIEALPRFNTVYVHLGLIEAITRNERFFPELDARFSWPLFFAAAAMISQLSQIDLLAVAAWVPLATMFAVLPAMWILVNAFANDRRLSFVALWFLLLGNWVGQDYLSPQGMNFILYVWFLALVAWFFRRPPTSRDWVMRVLGKTRLPRSIVVDLTKQPTNVAGARVGMLLIVVALATISAASHQLTPFAMIGASLALVIVGRTSLKSLPILVALITILWVSFAGQEFLLGNLSSLLHDVGNAGGTTGSAIGSRVRGSPGHVFVVLERILFSGAFWGLAFLGILRRLRVGIWDVAAVALAVVPFGIIGLQSYGGEIFLRVFLFTLPPMAFLAAAAIFPVSYDRSRLQTVFLVLLSAGMAVGFVIGRYGNERADIVEPGELAITDQVYRTVPQGSLVATVDYNSPILYRFYEEYRHFELAEPVEQLTPAIVAKELEATREGRPAYLFLTSGQERLEGLLGMPDGAWQQLTSALDVSPLFHTEVSSADGTLYRYLPAATP